VISGVDALIAKGWVDKDRLGSMGWSQGGYISAFITASSNRFKRCRWAREFRLDDVLREYGHHAVTRQYLHATPWDDPEIYKRTSPISYIAKAKTPTLIQHGENDRRVPIPNAFELRQRGRPRRAGKDGLCTKDSGTESRSRSSNAPVMEENEKWLRSTSGRETRGTKSA